MAGRLRLAGLVLAAGLAAGLLGGCGLGVDVGGVAARVAASEAATERKAKPKAKAKADDGGASPSQSPMESEPVYHKLGETTTGGSGIKVQVVKWEVPATVRMYKHEGYSEDTTTQLDYKPKAGYQWVRVETRLTNGTRGSLDVTCSSPVRVWLADADGDQFDPMQSQFLIPGNPECNVGVQPTVTATVTWVFEVPATAAPAGFIWQDWGDGLDSDGDSFFLYRFF